ncbi:conserved hypothetical protein [Gammaproteobacteria bacterium]
MKGLCVQIHTDISTASSAMQIISILEQIALDNNLVSKMEITSDPSIGSYMNINFETPDLLLLWKIIQYALSLTPEADLPRLPIIVVCEGEDSWSDYLLLYHYDKNEVVDTF